MNDEIEQYPVFEVPFGDGFLTVAGGWCAPSENVYSFGMGESFGPPRLPDCPDWNGPEPDACEARAWEQDHYGDYYEAGPVWRSWHSCKDEYRGPHAVCVCEDCGATRVIVQESKGA